ncbi:MAG TPA: hypothetical protein VIS56_00085 [Candidatus Saccharimonadales bacterium]
MADVDRDRHEGKNGNAAKGIAIAALIIAVAAFFWAIKADNGAGDAMEKAESGQVTQ